MPIPNCMMCKWKSLKNVKEVERYETKKIPWFDRFEEVPVFKNVTIIICQSQGNKKTDEVYGNENCKNLFLEINK